MPGKKRIPNFAYDGEDPDMVPADMLPGETYQQYWERHKHEPVHPAIKNDLVKAGLSSPDHPVQKIDP